MKLKFLIIFIFFFHLSIISQNAKQDDCKLYFSNIGIKDFNLGSNYNLFLNDNESKKQKLIKEEIYGIDVVIFSENIVLFNKKQTVEYNLKFHKDTLVAYSFKINIGDFKNANFYYNNVLNLIDRNKNTFIKGNNYYYMKTTKECQKFFQLDNDNTKDRFIYGGISYESQIWEQQFIEYMKATGQYK